MAAPPSWIQEEAKIRARGSDRAALETLLEGLATRAFKRLRPFGLRAGMVTVEIRRGEASQRRRETFQPGLADDETARGGGPGSGRAAARARGSGPSRPVASDAALGPGSQSPLFPGLSGPGALSRV